MEVHKHLAGIMKHLYHIWRRSQCWTHLHRWWGRRCKDPEGQQVTTTKIVVEPQREEQVLDRLFPSDSNKCLSVYFLNYHMTLLSHSWFYFTFFKILVYSILCVLCHFLLFMLFFYFSIFIFMVLSTWIYIYTLLLLLLHILSIRIVMMQY